MLETIKAEIQLKESNPDFDTFYDDYVMKVQDQGIDNEISFLFKKNKIDASNLCAVIEEDYKKLVST